jgi:OCT family organic cation transporter-like MFS transporter 4/5
MIPESFPWLIAKGRLEEAHKVLVSFASASGVKVDSNQLASVIKDVKMAEVHASTEKSKTGILDLIRTPRMRKRMIILSYNW